LRFGLLAYTAQGRDINLDIQRVVGYRQFCNKIWNAFKLVTNWVRDLPVFELSKSKLIDSAHIHKRDRWILSRLNNATKECQTSLINYQFANATTALFSFFLYDFCDVYLELVKPILYMKLEEYEASISEELKAHAKEGEFEEKLSQKKRITQATLYTVVEQYLRLLHPFMPFLTEELWQRLPSRNMYRTEESIMIAPYPKSQEEWDNSAVEKDMELVKESIHSARSLRSTYRIQNNTKAKFYFKTDSSSIRSLVEDQSDDFCTLAKGECLQYLELSEGMSLPKGHGLTVVSDQLSLLVDLTKLIDVETELSRLSKEVER
jgi:valyl-tRNA synthetase